MNLHLRGHEAQEQLLLQQLARNALPQTILFHGPKGIGKASFAMRLACHLLSGQEAAPTGLFGELSIQIDEQSAPVKRALGRSHGDLLLLEPELSGQNQTPLIKIDAARRVAEFFSKTSAESDWRVVIVDGADCLNMNAANALLKVVEEPPLNGVMLLIAHQPGKLLPTLLSRCRKLAFRAPGQAELEAILSDQAEKPLTPEELQALYVLASGSPGEALNLYHLRAHELYVEMLTLFQHYPAPQREAATFLLEYADKHAKEGGWPVWCRMWLRLVERIALASVGGLRDSIRADEAPLLTRIAEQKPPRFWTDLYETSANLISKAHGLHLDRKQVIHSLTDMAFEEVELAA